MPASTQSELLRQFYTWLPILKAVALLIIGLPTIVWLSQFLQKKLAKRLGKHLSLLIRHLGFYGGIIVIILMALSQLGFNVTALLGAAGIFGVTIGFASQTSISNIISGIFILLERSFKIGDIIDCQQATGTVQSIDLLSVQLKTNDGKLVRVPNEIVLKNIITNKTFYPYRRLSFYAVVRQENSINEVLKSIDQICKKNSLILDKPEMSINFNKLYSWGTKISIKFWTHSNSTVLAANTFLEACIQELADKKVTVYQNL